MSTSAAESFFYREAHVLSQLMATQDKRDVFKALPKLSNSHQNLKEE